MYQLIQAMLDQKQETVQIQMVDESELLGNTSKVNVEIYLENYEGTGYEKAGKTG